MIHVKKSVELVSGEKLDLPLPEDHENVYEVQLSIVKLLSSGRPENVYSSNQVRTSLHVTETQLKYAGINVPFDSIPTVVSSIEDNVVDFLRELGVRFED